MELKAITNTLSTKIDLVYLIAGLATFLSIMLAWKFTKKFRNIENRARENQSAAGQRGEHSEPIKTEENAGYTEDPANSNKGTVDSQEQPSSTSDIGKEFERFDEDGSGDAPEDIDPVEYSQHIPAHIKRAEQKVTLKKIEEGMTPEQKEHERKVQMEQMAAIFKLMQENKETFGVDSMDEVQSQMKLYM